MSITIILCAIIIIAFFAFLVTINKWKSDPTTLLQHKRVADYFPTIISTLGVLFTFAGITIGLVNFNPDDLTKSIPELLSGLKTAFFTSLLGMIGSIILSSIINKLFDDKGSSDSEVAAARIVNAVETMSRTSNQAVKDLRDDVKKQAQDQASFHRVVGDNFDRIKQNENQLATVITALAAELQGFGQKVNNLTSALDTLITIQRSQDGSMADIKSAFANLNSSSDTLITIQRSQDSSMAEIKNAIESLTSSLGNVEESTAGQLAALATIATQTAALTNIDHNVGEVLDITSGMSSAQDEISAEVKSFGDKLHAEVVEIEDSMSKTNKLLEQKFDEFSELLKKSNTEALVEVMKKVTEEFQTQMNALINKLIQENFDQLNKSVERLNTWQQENKEMIASLTSQYQQMATNFEATSTSLTKVKDDTQQLVSEGGKLRQLIDALNKVIVEDEKFLKLTSDLQTTANLSKDNMEKFDKATNELNQWVRKQRGFVDAVQVLLAKLEDLNKIKDYNEQFWQGTKHQMEEGVNIIKKASDTLNKQLTDIDRHFYERLSTTLAELDSCITALVQQKR